MATTALQRAFGEVLVRLAGERPGLLAVTGVDQDLVAWFTDVWPERTLTVVPGATRALVGQGVAAGGGDAVVVVDADGLTALGPQPVVLLTDDVAAVSAAYRAGVTVCQPGWQQDLPALLVGALGAGRPVLLHLAEPAPGLPAVIDPERTTFGDPRVLQRGPDGLVVGSGPTAPAAALVARRLAAEHVHVTALDSHTLTPESGVDPAVLCTDLLVGSPRAPRAGALQAVRVHPTDLAATVAAVRQALRATSPRR